MTTQSERDEILKEFKRLADEGEALAASVQKVAAQLKEFDARENLAKLKALTEKLEGKPQGKAPTHIDIGGR